MIFFETSAKTSVNVMEGFNKLAEQAVQIQEEIMIKTNMGIASTGSLRRPANLGKKGLSNAGKGMKIKNQKIKKKKKCRK